jgi:hypothetical protein
MALLLAMFVLWAYICSNFLFKTWYIATAIAVLALVVLIIRRRVRIDGLVPAVAPVLLYFAWLLASALWARYPEYVLHWVAIDAIQILVFVLFYIAGRNTRTDTIGIALISILIPSVIVATIMAALDDGLEPTVVRLAPYGLTLLPMLMPFLVLREGASAKPWLMRFAMAVAFALLIVGRSRAYLIVAMVLLVLSTFVYANSRALLRYVAISTVTVATLLVAVPTRPAVVALVVRFIHADASWGGVTVPEQLTDGTRLTLASTAQTLLPRAIPIGIGYMNMLGYAHDTKGRSLPLHSAYVSFFLEGGLPCVAIVLFLAWRFARSVRMAMRGPHREYAQALAIAGAGVLLAGIYHQVHQSPVLFLLLALAAALDGKEPAVA